MTRAEAKAIDAWAIYEYREHPKGLYHTCFVDGYKEGYEQAEKDIGWISVEKSLPPIGEEVIVLTKEMNGHELPDASHLCFAHLVDRRYAMDYNGWNIPGVRYWMYCPELPEE